MKKLYLIFFILSSASAANSQNLSWAKVLGSATSFSFGYSISIDAAGNSYSTGFYAGNVDFDPGPGVVTLPGSSTTSIYFAKYNSAGNLVWARNISPNGVGFNEGTSIALDGAGHFYLTGFFQGTADFNPGVGTAILTSTGNEDIFFARYDTNATFNWANRIPNTTSVAPNRIDIGLAITADAAGNAYLTGNFKGTADFDPGAGVVNLSSVPATFSDIFIAKYNAAGNFVWANRIGGASDDGANAIKTDALGNVHIAGYFKGAVDFDPGVGNASITGGADSTAFFAEYNSSGNFVAAKALAGSRSCINSLTLDPAGNIYITGFTFGASDFDPSAASFTRPSAPLASTWYIFFAKYSPTGSLIWAQVVNPTTAGSNNRSNSISVDNSGNVYIAGFYSGPNDFDPGPGTFTLGSTVVFPATNIFMARYDANGNFVWADAILETTGAAANLISQAFSIAADNAGNVYVTGKFHLVADFDPSAAVFNLTDPGGNNSSSIFIGRYFRPAILPIELISFTAKERNNTVVDCNWSTATEINNSFFTLERSRDAITFETVGIVPGAGNSTTVLNYSFTDETPYKGISYYHLKQTDFDGAFSFSEIVTAHIWPSTVAIFPTVSSDFFQVHFCSNYSDEDKMVLKIFSYTGQFIRSEKFTVGELDNRNYVFYRNGISHGIYLCTIERESGELLEQNKVIFQ